MHSRPPASAGTSTARVISPCDRWGHLALILIIKVWSRQPLFNLQLLSRKAAETCDTCLIPWRYPCGQMCDISNADWWRLVERLSDSWLCDDHAVSMTTVKEVFCSDERQMYSLLTNFFAHCPLHPNPLVQQIGNYTLVDLTKLIQKI